MPRPSRFAACALPLAVALACALALPSAAAAAIAPPSSEQATIRACVKQTSGVMRMVAARGACRRGEFPLRLRVVPERTPERLGKWRGPKGERGARGPAGRRGPAGGQGAPGAAGERGPAGPQGDPGPAGATGPAGAPGRDGADGRDGRDGADGSDGAHGLPGGNGSDGQDGRDGRSLTPRGNWSAATTYEVGDVVAHSIFTYVAAARSTGVPPIPGANTAEWMILAYPGPAGLEGGTLVSGTAGPVNAAGGTRYIGMGATSSVDSEVDVAIPLPRAYRLEDFVVHAPGAPDSLQAAGIIGGSLGFQCTLSAGTCAYAGSVDVEAGETLSIMLTGGDAARVSWSARLVPSL